MISFFSGLGHRSTFVSLAGVEDGDAGSHIPYTKRESRISMSESEREMTIDNAMEGTDGLRPIHCPQRLFVEGSKEEALVDPQPSRILYLHTKVYQIAF
jgi:hypothetical protein